MIFLRRTLTVALGFPLLAFFLLGIVSCQIGATVISADFYKDRLSSANFYEFALTDLSLTVIGELRRSSDSSPEVEELLLMTASLSDQVIVASLNRVLPQSWLRDTLEQALDEIVPYVAGDTDGFALRVGLKERAETFVEEIKYLLRESDAYVSLSEKIGELVAEEAAGVADELNLGVSNELILQIVTSTLTADWLQAQIESSLDNFALYILGGTDSFDMRSEVLEIARLGTEELEYSLIEAGAPDILFENILEPTIYDSLLEDLGDQSTVDVLEKLRSNLSGDLVWTEQDLLSLVESEFGAEGGQVLQQARTWISGLQPLGWLAWALVFALLISIGLLGGRNWPSRVTWGATYLVGVSVILYATFQVLSSTWNRLIEDSRVESLAQSDSSSQFARSQELITGKGYEIVADAGHVFIDGMARQSLIGLVMGLAVIGGVVGWRYRRTRKGKSR